MSIKNILISQRPPQAANPYSALIDKYGLKIDFRPLFVIEPLTSREFRAHRINFTEFTAVVFSSRTMIDAFFAICEELRIKVPDTLKYFCTTEAVAMYLQKHIVYRKRKIFYGNGTPASIIDLIGSKHKADKFLVATSAEAPHSAIVSALEGAGLDVEGCVFVKPVYQDIKDLDIKSYDMFIFYNQADVKSLLENYPDFQQGDAKFFAYGKSVEAALEEAGLSIAIKGPNPEVPSVCKGLELLLAKGN